MPPALILADDATGALECASLLARFDQRDLRIVDTQSRHLPPADAAAKVRAYAAGHPVLYKKTDPALRGNIAAELEALLPRTVVYIPAYPNLGRTVVDGQLFIHGVPVHQTDFARDPRHPIQTSRIADLFQHSLPIPDSATLAAHIHEPTILICDASTNDDLARLARALESHPHVAVAGPSGFIPHWAALHRFTPAEPPIPPRPAKWLIVRGSRHPQSIRQAAHARHLGLPVLEAPSELAADPAAIANSLATAAARVIDDERPGGVLIMGGDTVFALWRALGVTDIQPLPERLPGIAASWSPNRRILFVTKAGGFGDDTLVEQIVNQP